MDLTLLQRSGTRPDSAAPDRGHGRQPADGNRLAAPHRHQPAPARARRRRPVLSPCRACARISSSATASPATCWPTKPSCASTTASTAIFRIVQEALTNIARHAGASQVTMNLYRINSELLITIRDDGRGIREEDMEKAESLGLVGMRERVWAMNGEITISADEPPGTRIDIVLPVAGHHRLVRARRIVEDSTPYINLSSRGNIASIRWAGPEFIDATHSSSTLLEIFMQVKALAAALITTLPLFAHAPRPTSPSTASWTPPSRRGHRRGRRPPHRHQLGQPVEQPLRLPRHRRPGQWPESHLQPRSRRPRSTPAPPIPPCSAAAPWSACKAASAP
jgi:hypothetical protein